MRRSSTSKLRYRPKARRPRRAAANRRRDRRLRMDRLVRLPVQVFPVLPFVGSSVDGALVNLSVGGMALLIDCAPDKAQLARGAALQIHFRLPGMPLTECRAVITHAEADKPSGWLRLGVRFLSMPAPLTRRIQRMVMDDEACDARAAESGQPRCDLACSYLSLCSKPMRVAGAFSASAPVEISLQRPTR